MGGGVRGWKLAGFSHICRLMQTIVLPWLKKMFGNTGLINADNTGTARSASHDTGTAAVCLTALPTTY